MADAADLLAVLQHGDSFFPSGAISFSSGLETLHADGAVTTAETLSQFVRGQIEQRWACCDRPALAWAHRAGADLDAVAAVDGELEALALPAELRSGSRRAGAALLGVHARLGSGRAAAYRERVLEDRDVATSGPWVTSPWSKGWCWAPLASPTTGQQRCRRTHWRRHRAPSQAHRRLGSRPHPPHRRRPGAPSEVDATTS